MTAQYHFLLVGVTTSPGSWNTSSKFITTRGVVVTFFDDQEPILGLVVVTRGASRHVSDDKHQLFALVAATSRGNRTLRENGSTTSTW